MVLVRAAHARAHQGLPPRRPLPRSPSTSAPPSEPSLVPPSPAPRALWAWRWPWTWWRPCEDDDGAEAPSPGAGGEEEAAEEEAAAVEAEAEEDWRETRSVPGGSGVATATAAAPADGGVGGEDEADEEAGDEGRAEETTTESGVEEEEAPASLRARRGRGGERSEARHLLGSRLLRGCRHGCRARERQENNNTGMRAPPSFSSNRPVAGERPTTIGRRGRIAKAALVVAEGGTLCTAVPQPGATPAGPGEGGAPRPY